MSRPRLLILDEPSMGLAPIVVKGIFETLRALNRNDGLTILMAEQNAAIALRYADQATVIENGTDVLSDTADALRRGDYVKEFYLGSNVSSGIKREAGPQQPSAVSASDELQTIAAE